MSWLSDVVGGGLDFLGKYDPISKASIDLTHTTSTDLVNETGRDLAKIGGKTPIGDIGRIQTGLSQKDKDDEAGWLTRTGESAGASYAGTYVGDAGSAAPAATDAAPDALGYGAGYAVPGADAGVSAGGIGSDVIGGVDSYNLASSADGLGGDGMPSLNAGTGTSFPDLSTMGVNAPMDASGMASGVNPSGLSSADSAGLYGSEGYGEGLTPGGTVTAGTPTTEASGGLTGNSSVDKALNALSSGAKNYGGLGLAAMSAMKQRKAGGAQGQYDKIAAQEKATSDALLAQFRSGQLNANDSFAIADWSQKEKARIDQYYQKAGLSNSSMHQQAVSQIGAQAENMRQQAVQNLLSGGLKAAGVADPTLAAGVRAGMQQDQQAQQAQANFLAQLAKMGVQQAGSALQSPAPSPAPAPVDNAAVPE